MICKYPGCDGGPQTGYCHSDCRQSDDLSSGFFKDVSHELLEFGKFCRELELELCWGSSKKS